MSMNPPEMGAPLPPPQMIHPQQAAMHAANGVPSPTQKPPPTFTVTPQGHMFNIEVTDGNAREQIACPFKALKYLVYRQNAGGDTRVDGSIQPPECILEIGFGQMNLGLKAPGASNANFQAAYQIYDGWLKANP